MAPRSSSRGNKLEYFYVRIRLEEAITKFFLKRNEALNATLPDGASDFVLYKYADNKEAAYELVDALDAIGLEFSNCADDLDRFICNFEFQPPTEANELPEHSPERQSNQDGLQA